jgi:lipopolysaccharide transport system permease protein
MLADVWRYRSFIRGVVRREFSARYLSSALGGFWVVAGPLAMVAVYTIVLSRLMRARLPGVDDTLAYGVFACAGVVAWTAFAEVLSRCLTVFIDNASLLKKVSFPRVTLPVVVLLSSSIHFAIVFCLLVLVLAFSGRWPGGAIAAVVPLFLLQQAFALGLGIALGVVNVFVRDVGQLVAIALTFWFWLTPIVYPLDVLDGLPRRLVELNPLTRLIAAYQEIVLASRWPDWTQLGPQAVLALLALAAGALALRRLGGEMADSL